MSTPLIEAIARKQCEQHIREVRRWDTDPAKLEAMLPGAIDVNWQDHVALAQAALTAISEAGYVCVPREPTEAMLGAMREVPCDDALAGSVVYSSIDEAKAIYRAMISAAQGNG